MSESNNTASVKNRKKGIGKTIVQDVLLSDKYGSMVIVLVMCVIMLLLSRNFLTTSNIMNLLRQNSFYMMIACGMLVVFVSGEIDLCQGSTMCISGLIAAMLAQKNMPVVLIFIIAMAVGALVGTVIGILVGYIKIPAFIATLGMQMSVKGVVLIITSGAPVNNLSETFNKIGTGYIFASESFVGIPIPVVFMFAVCIITWFILSKTSLGRHIFATGGNIEAAIVSGINTKLMKTYAYIIDGIFCAVSGIVMTARFSSGQLSLGSGYEMYSIAGCVIGGVSMGGGVGTVFGAFWGTLVMTIMKNGMDLVQVNAYWQQFAQGAIIIVAVLIDIFRRKVRSN